MAFHGTLSALRRSARGVYPPGRRVLVACGAVALAAVACTAAPRSPTATPTPPIEEPFQRELVRAQAVRVIDGVTIEVQVNGERMLVRYTGVALPDPTQVDAEGGSLAEQATAYNRFLVEGRFVDLEQGWTEADSSGTHLRYVYVGGEMANVALITNGYATVADRPKDFRYRTSFLVAEENARANSRGVWASSASSAQPSPGPKEGGATPTPAHFGTLPLPPAALGPEDTCYFSDTTIPAIKGDVDQRTGDRVYHVPGGLFYSTTIIDEGMGDRWFCTEDEARAAGWKRSKY